MEQAAADNTRRRTAPRAKSARLYRSGMDTARIEAEGARRWPPNWPGSPPSRTCRACWTEIAHLHRVGVGAAFGVGVGQDDKDSAQEIAQLGQGGTQPAGARLLRAHRPGDAGHPRGVRRPRRQDVHSAGRPPDAQAAADAATVLALETKLALASKYPADLRDPQANYHKMTLAELDALTPGVDWQPYFAAVGLPDPGGDGRRPAGVLHGLGRHDDERAAGRLEDVPALAAGRHRVAPAEPRVR